MSSISSVTGILGTSLSSKANLDIKSAAASSGPIIVPGTSKPVAVKATTTVTAPPSAPKLLSASNLIDAQMHASVGGMDGEWSKTESQAKLNTHLQSWTDYFNNFVWNKPSGPKA